MLFLHTHTAPPPIILGLPVRADVISSLFLPAGFAPYSRLPFIAMIGCGWAASGPADQGFLLTVRTKVLEASQAASACPSFCLSL